ncbi:lactonase family protein [Burkholderia multivorans]|uniref:lactonase family protein n=1 Tax=Burkholderia multivorans TaxID=87883 RepID=UPI002018A15F|nr:lactonase family protein [Burkholderia multivorans]MCO1368647.1 lactonase family protein [Burkholderia multivorans]MCO1380538.1 lactonase family protein [Burkholderia multivorans]MDN8032397.1 lactonase family protein [Burkholderia multivorans]UQP22035.1 lactonase family protein [Burkholderia multivorans]UQP91517.1 lactonase family protein [Burkholderia multivorans]
MNDAKAKSPARLVAYVGCYATGGARSGGIHVFDVGTDGRSLTETSHVVEPQHAGYLVYSPSLGTLYSVDERKTDGRGPVGPAASVHAFAVSPSDGRLTWLNSQLAPGPMPTYLALDESRRILLTANHGDFAHIERVVQLPNGYWGTEYVYDDSTVIMFGIATDGRVESILDIKVLPGHGKDPNLSPQAGGHAQASAHAHCAVIDPSGQFVLVCDKGTDQIYVYRVCDGLEQVSTYHFEDEIGPRHVAFDKSTGRAFVTCEFSSELASFDFDTATGRLRLRDRVSTVDGAYAGLNEPADVRVHPDGQFVYVNNRGEDSLAWFAAGKNGELTRRGHVSISKSIHPGLAARSFAFDPTGNFVLVADRPANLVRSYAVDRSNGSLHPLTEAPVHDPAFIEFVTLPSSD